MYGDEIIYDGKQILPQLDPAFGRGVYILHIGSNHLTPAFHELVTRLTPAGSIACTCSIMDLMAGDTLRYERADGQRGFCMYFHKHPGALGTEASWCAVIHEASHYLSDQSPARDMANEAKAVKLWWKTVDQRKPAHGRRWVRAAEHLRYRLATIAGINVSAQMLFGQYGDGAKWTAALRAECTSCISKPIESILRTKEPRAFSKLFANERIAKPKTKRKAKLTPAARRTKPPTTPTPTPTPTTRRANGGPSMIQLGFFGGSFVCSYDNGCRLQLVRCERCPNATEVKPIWSTLDGQSVSVRCRCGWTKKVESHHNPLKKMADRPPWDPSKSQWPSWQLMAMA